ncbi:MAG: hypothetical protein J4F45_12940 [Pseudomonadales bacterium]|nr:hypothetical protein [Pseudomonadales bacterium]
MPFIPHTPEDERAMLASIGADSIDELFGEIEPALKTADFGALDDAVDEMTMLAEMGDRARLDEAGPCFTGAGCYDHHIPAAVWDIATRGEFMTAYTPYQAEASQGTLQVIYEYQSMVTALTAMEVSNASVYDGASALAESVLMALRAQRGKAPRVAVAGACHPHYTQTAANITRNQGVRLLPAGFDADGCASLDELKALAEAEESAGGLAAVVVQQPNFLGLLEPVDEITDWAAANGILVVAVVNPMSLGIIKHERRRHRLWRRPAAGHPHGLGRTVVRLHLHPAAPCPATSRTPGRAHGGPPRQARIHPHPAGPGTAHPTRQGEIEHLHQPGSVDDRGDHLPGVDGRRRSRTHGLAVSCSDARTHRRADFRSRRPRALRRAFLP